MNLILKTILLSLIFLFVGANFVQAQKNVPVVDYKGHILYGKKQIGQLTKTGSLDHAGKAVTKLDSYGNVVDSTGKTLGKPAKGQNFVYYFKDKPEQFSIGEPSHSGMCEVKNSKGEIVMLLHENYKAQAACAVHCLYENKCMPESKMQQ